MDINQGTFGGQSQPGPQDNTHPQPPDTLQSESPLMSDIGAGVGAGAGALIWFGIAYVSGFEFAYIAVLVGAMAGWGAVWLGKVRSEAVGYIAAVAGLLGILTGSYLSYNHGFHVEIAKAEFRQDFYYARQIEDPEFDYLTPAEKEAMFEKTYEQAAKNAPGYFASLAEQPFDLIITLIFGGLGVYYGYRVGSGTGRKDAFS